MRENELRARLAREVLEWHLEPSENLDGQCEDAWFDKDGFFQLWAREWRPETDMMHTWMAVDALAEAGWRLRLEQEPSRTWKATLTRAAGACVIYGGYRDARRAICDAALRVARDFLVREREKACGEAGIAVIPPNRVIYDDGSGDLETRVRRLEQWAAGFQREREAASGKG